MSYFNNLIHQDILSAFKVVKEYEALNHYILILECEHPLPENFTQALKTSIEEIVERIPGTLNSAYISSTIDGSGAIRINLLNNSVDNGKINEISSEIQYFSESDKISISIEIEKKLSNRNFIFSLPSFLSYISSLSVESLLIQFSFISNYDEVVFLHWDSSYSDFSSETITFTSNNAYSPHLGKNKVSRENELSSRDAVCHFNQSQAISLCPSDMIFCEKAPREFREISDRAALTIIIAFLFDNTDIRENSVSYKLKGYKLISENNRKIDHVDKDLLGNLSRVYRWCYGDGTFSDKIGIARNILSIHCPENSILKLDSDVLPSIVSGYQLYLKENAKQYIEIRNKITEFLFKQTDSITELTRNLYSGFKSTLWAFVTFSISFILLRVMRVPQSSTPSEVADSSFSIGSSVLVIGFLLVAVSVGYLILLLSEINDEKDRVLGQYSTVRDRYLDLMHVDDLDKIISVEELVKNDNVFINKQKSRYLKWWVASLLLFSIAIITIYFIS